MEWKFRTVDRAVQFDPDKYGWPWFPGEVSWVIPTAFSVIALRQSLARRDSDTARGRIELGIDMLGDRACPQGGWNAGNGIVLGTPLQPHIDSTAIALLALSGRTNDVVDRGLLWLRRGCADCSSVYSLAWSAIALSMHVDSFANICVAMLERRLSEASSEWNIEALSLGAIAIQAVHNNGNPFRW